MPIEKSTKKPVPPALIPTLVRYTDVMNRARQGGAFWTAAREALRCTAVFLAWRLFGADVPEAEALERVRFSAGFAAVWLESDEGAKSQEPGAKCAGANIVSASGTRIERGGE